MQSFIYLVFGAAAAVLAAGPVGWLIGTWTEPGYPGYPALVFAVVVAIFAWSVSSPWAAFADRSRGRRFAVGLLLATLLIRLASQLLAINVVGAFALAVDVYALGLLMGVSERRRPVSAGWLAVLFLFCLPVEPIFQRSVGYLLQQMSAAGSCQLLGAFFTPLECAGTRILVMGREVLVDVPCSGARVLTTLLMSVALLGALVRPSTRSAVVGVGITLASAWCANVFRITILAVGIVFREASGVDVMAAPWHEAVGLVSLALGMVPVVFWAHRTRSGQIPPARVADRLVCDRGLAINPAWRLSAAAVVLVVAVSIVQLEPEPVDVSAPVPAPLQPANLAGYGAAPALLSNQEQGYFTRYGGTARRTHYGPFTLLLVRTTSPLRHLHAPDVCLAGAGHEVRYLTSRFTSVPTAFYRSVDPDGATHAVRVSFVSASGQVATSVSEVVWRWLSAPDEAWTMVQRIAPESSAGSAFERWDAAVARAYNLNAGELSTHRIEEEISWPEWSI